MLVTISDGKERCTIADTLSWQNSVSRDILARHVPPRVSCKLVSGQGCIEGRCPCNVTYALLSVWFLLRCSLPPLRHELGFDEEVAQHEEFGCCFARNGCGLPCLNAADPQSPITLYCRWFCAIALRVLSISSFTATRLSESLHLLLPLSPS